jgi:hypothetical protein
MSNIKRASFGARDRGPSREAIDPESCFAATPDGLAGTAHTAGLADAVADEVADILSSQGKNFHHLLDVSAGLLLDAAPCTRTLLLMLNLCRIPGNVVIPATSSRACSLPGRTVLADTLVADILVTLTGISLRHRLLSGDCRIIHLDLLVPAAKGYTSGTPGAAMRG